MKSLIDKLVNKEISRSEYFKIIDNRYEEAILQGRETDFLLGKGEYLYERDEDGKHSGSLTMSGVFGYRHKYGNKKMLEKFNSDIHEILQTDISLYDFYIVIYYIYLYNKYYFSMKGGNPTESDKEENIIEPWNIDIELKKLITNHYNKFKKLYGHLSKDSYKWIPEDPGYGFFLYEAEGRIKNIKERFGIDLLIEK
jgi:hypothetical protein